MQDIKETCRRNVEEFGDRSTMFPAWSADAAEIVENNTLDFVYLDARHDFNGVFEDLSMWWPKLKAFGILAGHDYCDGERPEGDFFVQTAVNAFLGIKNGTCPPKNMIYRTFEYDRYVSFFIHKTAEVEERVKTQILRSSMATAHVYPRYSPYFSLFHKSGSGKFVSKCRTLCGFDCERRLRDLWPEVYSKRSAGAYKVDRDSSGAAQTIPEDFHSYSVECPRRCDMTCNQKKTFFEGLAKQADFTEEEVFIRQRHLWRKVGHDNAYTLLSCPILTYVLRPHAVARRCS